MLGRCTGEQWRAKALFAVVTLVMVTAGGGKAQKKPLLGGRQRCVSTAVDDQETALLILQELSDPKRFHEWFGTAPAGGLLAQYFGGQPERNPMSWPDSDAGMLLLSTAAWAADAVPMRTAEDDPCGFVASMLLCDALPAAFGDPYTATAIGTTVCSCSCSVVQPTDGFDRLTVRHGCPSDGGDKPLGGDKPSLPVTWTAFGCPRMSWGIHGQFIVQNGGAALLGSGTDLSIAVLGGTMESCAEACINDVNCDAVRFGYDRELHATFCLLLAASPTDPTTEVASVADATHAVWQLLIAAVNKDGADKPIDEGFVDAQSQGKQALHDYRGQYSAACYQERMCWTSVCLDQEAVAVRATGSLSLTNSSDKECATAVVAPEGYQVDWRLDSMSRAAHVAAGRLELYYDVSPHAGVAQVFEGGMSCSKDSEYCAVTGRSPGPVLYVRERPGSIGASWKISWNFVLESEAGCTACVSGCMQSNATNFNPAATVDDRSCSFAGLACVDHVASNYDHTLALDAPYPGQCAYTCDSLVSRYIFGPGLQEAAHSEVGCFHVGDAWKASLSNSKRKGITPPTSKLATSIDVLLLGTSDWLNVSSLSGCGESVNAHGSFIIQGSAYSPQIALQIEATGPMAVLRWVTFTTARCHRYKGPNAVRPMALWLGLGSNDLPVGAVIERCSFVGLSNADQGGAIMASRGSTVHIEHCRFVRCHALMAGALRIDEAKAWIRNTIFELNYAETSLVSVADGYTGTAGAIHAAAATIQSSKQTHLSLESCEFNNNGVILDNELDRTYVRGGWTIHLEYLHPAIWWILDSDFAITSYDPLFSVYSTASGTLSCSEHPCPLGYGCSVAQSSLHCEACSPSQYSGDGIGCAQCTAGKQASSNASFCEDCPPGLYSDAVEALRCSRCPEGQRANNRSTACFAPLCREGSYSTTHAQCLCPIETYNSSKGTVACLDASNNHLEPAPLPEGLHCQPCPPCLICKAPGSTPMIAQGWAHPTTSVPQWTLDGPSRDTRIYSCPHDEDNARGDLYVCKSNTINASTMDCANGFDGALCGTCAVGFTRESHRDCISCPEAHEELRSRYIIVVAAIVVILLIRCIVGKLAKSIAHFISANHVMEVVGCVTSSLQITLSMVQIVAQFSAVLNFSFKDNTPQVQGIHQMFSRVLLDLKVLVDLGCWGLAEKNIFYAKFLADLLIVPGALCSSLLVVYTCGSRIQTNRAIRRSTSSGGSSDLGTSSGNQRGLQLQSELDAVQSRKNVAIGWIYGGIFLVLPRMTTAAFSAFDCRDVGDTDGKCEKWLEAAYAVDCCSDEYALLVLSGAVGAAAVLALPLGLGLVLTQETRKNWRGFEQERMGAACEPEATRNPTHRNLSPSSSLESHAFESHEAHNSDYRLTVDFFDEMWLFDGDSKFQAYNYSQLEEHFGSFVHCYRPGAYYWEIVEVIYKIIMSGFLMFAPGGRGSVGQLFCGLLVSFLMGALHVRIWPYRHRPDNWLRFAAEIQIFQTLAVALVLKSGATHSALDALDRSTIDSAYDWLLVVSFWVLSPVAMVVAVCAKLATLRRTRQQNDDLLQDAWRASGYPSVSSTGIELASLPEGERSSREQTPAYELHTFSCSS